MKILVKFPTRERPHKFLQTLQGYRRNQTTNQVHYMITLDANDGTMNNEVVLSHLKIMKNLSFQIGVSRNKVAAINRDMDQAPAWDICIVASDDMICRKEGWDERIITDMQANFPDTDGCLWYHDGDKATHGKLSTMVIMGRKYFNEREGFLYHPSYQSLWCDNEYTQVALQLGKIKRYDDVLFKHVHFSNTPGMQPDRLIKRNQGLYFLDKAVYEKRLAVNFNI